MLTRKIKDLPLGTRFRIPTKEPDFVKSTWVLLEKHGHGLCARWEGINGPTSGQSVCSIVDTPTANETLVEVIPADVPDGCGNCPEDHGCTYVDGWHCERGDNCGSHKYYGTSRAP